MEKEWPWMAVRILTKSRSAAITPYSCMEKGLTRTDSLYQAEKGSHCIFSELFSDTKADSAFIISGALDELSGKYFALSNSSQGQFPLLSFARDENTGGTGIRISLKSTPNQGTVLLSVFFTFTSEMPMVYLCGAVQHAMKET